MSDKYNQFDGMDKEVHSSPDICGFLILDRLAPITTCNTSRIITCNWKLVYLRVALAENATEQEVEDLLRCGIDRSGLFDRLCMYY